MAPPAIINPVVVWSVLLCHSTPQPTEAPETAQAHTGGNTVDDTNRQTAPPESTFRKLRPAKSRYSLLRDEL